ncbi:MAG TPA: ATP-binding protein, partial [Frankiaceae bacterium]|nr:ATP-binding protein [Frankiaceae bacterium]
EITPVAGGVLTGSALNADERIANAVKGLDHLDERLAPLVEVVPQPASPLPPSQRAIVTAAVDLLRRSAPEERPPLIQLVGPHRHARAAVAASIAAEVDCELFRLPARLLPAGPADIDLTARLWHREAVLAPVALFLDEEDGDDTPGSRHALTSFLSRSGGLLLLGGRDVTDELPGPTVALDVAGPTAAEQRAAWEEAVGPDGGVDVAPLVAQFDLDVDTIRSVVRYAGPLPDGPRGTRVLWAEARRQLRPRLESAAQRVEPVATWESLVLPEPELAVLHQIAGQVAQRSRVYTDWGFGARMNRGLGITALFAGESGTGKSMAAEVLANDCDLDLYRIDLSSVVSKYIGETEKNLRRLFDAAEGGGVILFFDEADALFGKRSEVKDAHDRYANIEVNFLLQRMEVYRGLAILATNMRGALDRAFTRRLRFIVTFPFPRPADRARMWQIAFPPHVPLGPLDISRLSRIDLTGAGVANAALNAAFLAAAAGHPVGMAEVLTAVRTELRKLERPINEADFRLEGQVRV